MKTIILCLSFLLFISLQTTAQQQHWVNTNPSFSSESVRQIKFKNPQVGFLLIGLDLWRTTDEGESFSLIDSTGHYFEIYIFGDSILAVGHYAILSSTDDCNTFEFIEYPEGFNPYDSFFRTSTWWTLRAQFEAAFIMTADGGINWTEVTLPWQPMRNGMYFSDSLHWIVATYDPSASRQLYQTSDGGISWDPLLPYNSFIFKMFWSKNVVIIETNQQIFISSDGGVNFYPRVRPTSPGRVVIKDEFITYYANDKNFYLTYDYAVTWQSYPGAMYSNVSMDAVNDSVFYVGGDAGSVYKSVNQGDDWICLTKPAFRLTDISVPEPGIIYAGGENLMRSFNDGRSWEVIYGPGIFFRIYFKNALTGFAQLSDYNGGNYNFVKTIDGGISWDTLYSWTSWQQRIFEIYFVDDDHGFVIGEGVFFRTTDGGNTWDFNYGSGGYDINFMTPKRGYIASGNTGYLTTDGGISWQPSTKYAGSTICFVDTLTGFRGYGYALQKTTDGGETYFDLINHGQFDSWSDLNFWGRDTGIVHFEEHEVILMTTDCGKTWDQIFAMSDGYAFRMKFLSPSYGWIVVDQYAQLIRYGKLLTNVEQTEITGDKDYNLSQNFPNPFNPSTTINYQIPEESFVTLKIYDVLGNLISVLLNEEKAAGNYNINFNAAGLTSGVYFYRLQAGDFVETRKMILLR